MKILSNRFTVIVGPAALMLLTLCVFQLSALTALATTTVATVALEDQSLAAPLGRTQLWFVREQTPTKGDPDRPVIVGQIPNNNADKAKANATHPNLIIKEFLFPPADEKTLRVHVANTGNARAGAGRLVLSVREIKGEAVRTKTHVKVFSSLGAGASVWLVIDARSILPDNVSLESTTFKLNVYATEIVAVSDAPEVRHAQLEFTAATPTSAARRLIEGYAVEFYAGGRLESGKKEPVDKLKAKGAEPDLAIDSAATQSSDSFYGTGVYKSTDAGSKDQRAEREPDSRETTSRLGARVRRPDLRIRQFLFPPTNDKALRVHVVNTGQAASTPCRLVLTVRKINGVAVGRKTHVNVPALAAGADDWLHIDVKSILPNNVSLQSTTFKLNVDATAIVAESDEGNNEVWHNQ